MQLYDHRRVREIQEPPRWLALLLSRLAVRRFNWALIPVRIQPVRVRERGQAVVEFLIVLGVFLTLILGLICVGQMLLANYTVNQAARAAAHQAAIQGGTPAAAYSAAQDVIDSGVGTSSSGATVNVTCVRTPCRRYDPITVTIAYNGSFWTPMPPLFTTFSVRAQATRAAERDQQ